MALPRLLSSPFRRQPPDTAAAFDRWLQTGVGAALIDSERHVLDELLPRMVGYSALQCSVGTPRSLLAAARIRQQLHASAAAVDGLHIRGLPSALPVRQQSLDLVVLHHNLDFDDDPHQVLSEAVRTLVPGGTLVVVGFNPTGLWGLLKLFRLGSLHMPWRARFLSAHRIGDWLNVLGCEPEGVESRLHMNRDRWPGRWLARLGERFWSRHGAFYVMVARKRAMMIRPVPVRRASAPERAPNVIPVPVAHWRRKPHGTPGNF